MGHSEEESRGDPHNGADEEELLEFASTVAHDIRSPLLVARGNLELVETDDEERLEAAHGALDRIEEILQNLTRYARDGSWATTRQPVELPRVAREAWGTVPTHDAGLRIETEQVVSADPDCTRQLLQNLIDNAVRHGGSGVTVTVSDLDETDGRGEGRTGFVVEDDGHGIRPDRRGRVLEPGVSTADGTGYGLAIVDRFAAEHGWAVAVTESDAGGARFEFSGVERVEE